MSSNTETNVFFGYVRSVEVNPRYLLVLFVGYSIFNMPMCFRTFTAKNVGKALF